MIDRESEPAREKVCSRADVGHVCLRCAFGLVRSPTSRSAEFPCSRAIQMSLSHTHMTTPPTTVDRKSVV